MRISNLTQVDLCDKKAGTPVAWNTKNCPPEIGYAVSEDGITVNLAGTYQIVLSSKLLPENAKTFQVKILLTVDGQKTGTEYDLGAGVADFKYRIAVPLDRGKTVNFSFARVGPHTPTVSSEGDTTLSVTKLH